MRSRNTGSWCISPYIWGRLCTRLHLHAKKIPRWGIWPCSTSQRCSSTGWWWQFGARWLVVSGEAGVFIQCKFEHIGRDGDGCHMHFLIIIVMSMEQQMTSYKLTIEAAHNVISWTVKNQWLPSSCGMSMLAFIPQNITYLLFILLLLINNQDFEWHLIHGQHSACLLWLLQICFLLLELQQEILLHSFILFLCLKAMQLCPFFLSSELVAQLQLCLVTLHHLGNVVLKISPWHWQSEPDRLHYIFHLDIKFYCMVNF